jgi:hypothetical protein
MAPVQFGDDDYENQHHHQKEEEGETMNAQQLLAGSGDLDIVYAPDAGACRLVWSRGGEKTTSGEAVTLLATATMAC